MTSPSYQFRKTKRARRLSITIHEDGRIRLTVPYRVSNRAAYAFIVAKMGWIERHLAKQKRTKHISYPFTDQKGYIQFAPKARKLLQQRTEELSEQTGLAFQRIAIRNQKTRWGSCSSKGTLSYNYKLYFLPEQLRDYIIIHELCHTKHMNHGIRFWSLVEKHCPEYREYEKQLKKFKL